MYKLSGKDPRSGPKISNKVEDHIKKDDKMERLYNQAKELGFSGKSADW